MFLMVNESIRIVPYHPIWPMMFERLRGCLLAAVGDLVVTVEHVGSTAVPGLAAKPILDVDVVVRSSSDVAQAIRCLGKFGYEHVGDQGVGGREAFVSPPGTPLHHLYLVVQGAEPLRNHISFRDYLRAHPEKAEEYELLKQTLAVRFADDRHSYTEGKTEFVKDVLGHACQSARPSP